MASSKKVKRITVPALRARKGGEPIACLTAYTAPVAELLDPNLDLLLVGDIDRVNLQDLVDKTERYIGRRIRTLALVLDTGVVDPAALRGADIGIATVGDALLDEAGRGQRALLLAGRRRIAIVAVLDALLEVHA